MPASERVHWLIQDRVYLHTHWSRPLLDAGSQAVRAELAQLTATLPPVIENNNINDLRSKESPGENYYEQNIQGAPTKTIPLEKFYISANKTDVKTKFTFCYRGRFRQYMHQISWYYLVGVKNYNHLNVKVYAYNRSIDHQKPQWTMLIYMVGTTV